MADLARRLQDRVDGQEALLDRVAVLAQLSDDRARIAELRDIGRRLRRDSEALLLLCGADPGVHRGAPHTVSAVLGDAVALVDEPSRVTVRPRTAGDAGRRARPWSCGTWSPSWSTRPPRRRRARGSRSTPGWSPTAHSGVEVVVAGRGWTDALGAPGAAPAGRRGSPSGSPGGRPAGSGWSGR